MLWGRSLELLPAGLGDRSGRMSVFCLTSGFYLASLSLSFLVCKLEMPTSARGVALTVWHMVGTG